MEVARYKLAEIEFVDAQDGACLTMLNDAARCDLPGFVGCGRTEDRCDHGRASERFCSSLTIIRRPTGGPRCI